MSTVDQLRQMCRVAVVNASYNPTVWEIARSTDSFRITKWCAIGALLWGWPQVNLLEDYPGDTRKPPPPRRERA